MSGWAAAAAAAMDFANSGFGAWQSSKAARRQIAWQREQYNNRYQWTVEDMRKAGLNPILASMNGVSSAGGITAEPANSTIGQNLGRHLMTKQQEAEIENTEANSGKAVAETETQEAYQRLLSAQEKQVLADTALKNVSTALQTLDYNFSKNNPDWYKLGRYNKADPTFGRFLGMLENLFGGNSAKGLSSYRYEDSR